MSQPETAPPAEHPERLTLEEVERRHPDEWVVLIEDDYHENNGVTSSGVVFTHDPNRSVVLERSRHLRRAVIHYTGKRGSFILWLLENLPAPRLEQWLGEHVASERAPPLQAEPTPLAENAERLSWEEIQRRYPDEWVVLVDDDFHENHMKISRGVVYAHSPDRSVAIEQSRHLRDAALLYTGKIGSFTIWALQNMVRRV
jgi:hypothetical protein